MNLEFIINESLFNSKNHNMLLEGDNIVSLNYLLKNFKEKINHIYIDPPYNTGKTFIYKDSFSSNKDKHSLWLDFMRERLVIAKELMSPDALIFLSIDDNEFAHLKLLCDSIFGESNYLSSFCVIASTEEILTSEDRIKTLGTNLGQIKHSHEYILCYRKSKEGRFYSLNSENEYIHSRLTNKGNKISTLTFPKGLLCEKNISKTFYNTIGGAKEPLTILNQEGMIFKDGILMNDVVIEAEFRNPKQITRFFNGEEVLDFKNQKIRQVYFKKTGVPFFIKDKLGEIPCSILSGYGDTSEWGKRLKTILDTDSKEFNYVKPFPMLEYLISISTNRSDSICLDFFAGSGTLGEAVLSLNKKDDGTRKFILCQSDENNICREITYNRICKLLTNPTLPYFNQDSFGFYSKKVEN